MTSVDCFVFRMGCYCLVITKEVADTDGPNVVEHGLSKGRTCEVGHM